MDLHYVYYSVVYNITTFSKAKDHFYFVFIRSASSRAELLSLVLYFVALSEKNNSFDFPKTITWSIARSCCQSTHENSWHNSSYF